MFRQHRSEVLFQAVGLSLQEGIDEATPPQFIQLRQVQPHVVMGALEFAQQLRMWLARAKSPEEGAGCLVQVATDPEIEGVTGSYFVEGKLAESSSESYDLDVARRLWEISERLVGQSFAFGYRQTSHSAGYG